MKRTVTSFPVQKLPLSKKTDKWREDCVDYCIGEYYTNSSSDQRSAEQIQTNIDLYNSIYNEKDLKYVTNPFKQEEGFPAMAQDYNIIRPKIDLLIGEETKRPFNFRVCRTSYNAGGDIQDTAKELLFNYVQAYIMSKLSPEGQIRYQEALESGEIMLPEQIQKYLAKDYKDIAEDTAYHILNYNRQKLNIDHEFVKGWEQLLTAGSEFFYVGIRNGAPHVEMVDSRTFRYVAPEGVEFVHDAERCVRKMIMTASQIYDTFYDKMEESKLNELLDYVEGTPSGSGFGKQGTERDDYNHIETKVYNRLSDRKFTDLENIAVYHVCWRSFKKIGFVTYFDEETGNAEEIQVDEFYKVTGNEINVEWKWIVEVWEGYRIGAGGNPMYIGIQPIEYQYIDETLNSQRLPYTGVIRQKSLVELMKPLQYFFIIIWYRIELAMAKDKGKIINVDITQIPKSMGIDPAKWLHYLSSVGVNFINPYETGWDIPGRSGGNPASFNQMTSMDASMTQVIADYVGLMNKIEAMVSEISGISPQREGAITASELVGNVERSVVQSALITEPLFWVHGQVKKHVLTQLLNTAKFCYKNSDQKFLHYVLNDATRTFLRLSDDFPYETFDIFVTDTTKEVNTIEQIKNLIQPAMQNGASLTDAIEILTADNISILRSKMEQIENDRMEREQAIREQEAQRAMEIEQVRVQLEEQKMVLDQAKLDLEKYKIDTDATVRITVAELNAYRGSENMDQDVNGIPDPMQIADAALNQRKVEADIANKNLDAAFKLREADSKRKLEEKKIAAQERSEQTKATIEKRKLDLEEKKLRSAEKLQRMADQAAMEREKLKASTALKNKVVGESKKK